MGLREWMDGGMMSNRDGWVEWFLLGMDGWVSLGMVGWTVVSLGRMVG